MFSNRLAFGVLALASVTAAGGGAYLATRQNAGPTARVRTDTSVATSPAAPVSAPKPVQETEAVIGDTTRSGRPAVTAPATLVTTSTAAPVARKREEAPAPSRPAAPQRTANAAATRNTQLPTLERSWPSGASTAAPAAAPADPPAVAQIEERTAPEPPRVPDPPQKTFQELIVSANSVVGLQTETAISSETARVEDRIEARVVRDVRAGGSVAIPAGSRAIGSVMVVERGSKFKDRARLGIRFHTLVLADGTRLPITTETIYRYGEAPGQASATKVGGGAVVGAILGAIAGGAKGAAIGATVGAGAGTATVAAGDRSAAAFPAGAEVTARMLSPVTVTIEK